MGVEIRLLGAIDAYRDGARVEVKGGRQRTLLAYLAMTPGRPRPIDQLVEVLWPGDDLPAEPRQNVHTYASRLRAALGTDAVVARDGGYELAVSPMDVRDGSIACVEVKAALDVDEHDFRHMVYLRDRLGDRFQNGVVLHLGRQPLAFGDRLTALPVSALWTEQ